MHRRYSATSSGSGKGGRQAARVRPSAFTLIELLVVIAIIAILAAILFPVFARARDKARQTSCASNMKQWSLALLQYVQDFDETVPVSGNPNGTFPDGTPVSSVQWYKVIVPYAKNTDIYQCASDPNEDVAWHLGRHTSYLFNDYTSHWPWGQNPLLPSPDSLANFVAPADTVMMAEGYMWDGGPIFAENAGCLITGMPDTSVPDNWMANTWPCQTAKTVAPFHSGGANFGFADGHVKWYKVADGEGANKRPLLNKVLPWTRHGDPKQDPNNKDHQSWF